MTTEDFGEGEGPDAVPAQEPEVPRVDDGLRSAYQKEAMEAVDLVVVPAPSRDNPPASDGTWDDSWEDTLKQGTD